MAVQQILSTDTLETGFRLKANESFGAIIVSATPQLVSGVFTGIIRLNCFDNSFINLDLRTSYYTQTQITTLLAELTGSVYSGAWNSALAGGYKVLSVVDHNGNLWRSNNSGNSDEPGTGVTWSAILNLPPVDITSFDEPFTAISNKSINWQTDIPNGQTLTYVQLRGNGIQKPFVYTGAAGGAKTWNSGATIIITYTDSSETMIDTVSLDWGFSSDGKIAW